MRRGIRRKGFTLVELLIVIVVIGILAAMMMMSSTEAVSSAKANNIVTNLVAMKTAALLYYLDHSDKTPEELKTELTNANLLPYLKKQSQVKDAGDALKGYSVVVDEWGDWYACCDINEVTGSSNKNNAERAAILRKLEGRAKSSGLEFSGDNTGKGRTTPAKDSRYIYLWIR